MKGAIQLGAVILHTVNWGILFLNALNFGAELIKMCSVSCCFKNFNQQDKGIDLSAHKLSITALCVTGLLKMHFWIEK